MCVIIHRPANITFPFEKLKAACTANADGFGIAFTDRGRLEIHKEFTPSGNDPERLAKLMEEVLDRDVFVHLRLRSIGNKNLDNCHPFIAYQNGDYTLALMHNGTMPQFDRKDGKTDSETWGREVLLPFATKFRPDEGDLLDDDDFQRLIAMLVPSGSKIAMFDSRGHHFIANKAAGAIVDGCWASNEYSFRAYSSTSYRGTSWEPKITDAEVTHVHEQGRVWSVEKQGWVWPASRSKEGAASTENAVVPFDAAANSGTGSGTTSKGGTTPRVQFGGANDAPKPNTALTPVNPADIRRVPRNSFCELAEIDNLDRLSELSKQDVLDLVTMYPEECVLLIMDLIAELYDDYENADEAEVIEVGGD